MRYYLCMCIYELHLMYKTVYETILLNSKIPFYLRDGIYSLPQTNVSFIWMIQCIN